MTKSLSRVQAIFLSTVLFIGMLLGGLGIYAAGSREWVSNSFPVRASFHDVGGIKIGTPVQIQGLAAGKVDAIELPQKPGGPVLVRMQLDNEFRHLVTADAKIQIGGEGLLSGKILRVVAGESSETVADNTILAGESEADLTKGLADATTKLNKILGEADHAIKEFQAGKGPIGDVTTNLKNASTKLDNVLARADNTLGELQKGKGTLGKLMQDEELYDELKTTVSQVNSALEDVRYGNGTLGKLVKNAEIYNEALNSLKDVRQMVTSVKQNSDAIKSLPIVRSYVVDVNKELNRPSHKRYRMYMPETRLFEPGRAVLTEDGKRALDAAAQWLNDRKDEGSEVVVAGFADPKQYEAEFAHQLTIKQAEVVKDYLVSKHQIQRVGWWWWSNRTVTSVGSGTTPSPVPERERLPGSRIELIVFVPET